MIYLDLDDLLHIVDRVVPHGGLAQDPGLLMSALYRPRTTVDGTDAYPTVEAKAAALLHSLARNHGLVDGNKRLALGATIAFLGLNGRRLGLSNDEAYELVMQVAIRELNDVEEIARRLRTVPW